MHDMPSEIRRTPWDAKALKIPTYEILELSDHAVKWMNGRRGHYTLRKNPLEPKGFLEKLGFYYCDTLLEPFCSKESLVVYPDSNFHVKKATNLERLLPFCKEVFAHDRFHKDKNIGSWEADLRYVNWLSDLFQNGSVFSLWHKDDLVGFWAYQHNSIVLHALKKNSQGKGFAKPLWSKACVLLFEETKAERIKSSISASNLPVMNVYASLGFKFKTALDVYHKIQEKGLDDDLHNFPFL